MGGFVDASAIVYRLMALALVAFWIIQIAIAARQPPEWRPPRADRFPIRISRNAYLVSGVLGIIAGLAVFAYSFVFFR